MAINFISKLFQVFWIGTTEDTVILLQTCLISNISTHVPPQVHYCHIIRCLILLKLTYWIIHNTFSETSRKRLPHITSWMNVANNWISIANKISGLMKLFSGTNLQFSLSEAIWCATIMKLRMYTLVIHEWVLANSFYLNKCVKIILLLLNQWTHNLKTADLACWGSACTY